LDDTFPEFCCDRLCIGLNDERCLSNPYLLELLAGSGFDWLLIDTEHSPADIVAVLPQLQAAAAYPVSAVARPASNDAVLIKRLLDLGAQTLLIPR
jgi:4-hydroxy-2-oxoheptanedioate aldolase